LDSKTSYNTYFILSASLDGILILWNLDQAKNTLVPLRKMMVDPRYLQKAGVTIKRKTDVGITCLSCNAIDNASIVFGTESGAIFEGSLTNHNIIHVQVSEKVF
jgi:hypothetical protein